MHRASKSNKITSKSSKTPTKSPLLKSKLQINTLTLISSSKLSPFISKTPQHAPPFSISQRHFARPNLDKPKKLSQAEIIIQQHKAKQLEAQQTKKNKGDKTKTSLDQPKSNFSQTPPPSSAKNLSPKPISTSQDAEPPQYQRPMAQPSAEFLRDHKEGKVRPLPPGMTIEELNKMSPEVIAKTLNIDMSIVDAINDDQEDEFPVKFSEDDYADVTPPLPFKPDPGSDGTKYAAARIQGRHTINMMPSITPRPHNHKGRLTIIRKLPPQFASIHKTLRGVTKTLLKLQKLPHFDLAVTLVAAQGMQYINKQHRFVDAPTDVISFTMEEPYCEGIPVELGNIADLGEIILSVPYIYAQASIRHAMLRQLGFDLSDSKRPLGDLEKVRKLFSSVGDITINPDGSLKIANLNEVVDIAPADDKPFGQNAYKLAGNSSLPQISLTSQQLDSLPPFDNDHISATIKELVSSQEAAVMSLANQQRKSLHIQKSLHSIGLNASAEEVLRIQNRNDDANGENSPNGEKDLATTSFGNTSSNPLSSSAQKWSLSQGFPPRDYFKYITESMVVDEMNIVLIHGFLHLCGYDHDTAERRERMQAETDRAVAALLKSGSISQRCADLATLYDLEDAPEFVDESSEDELLPAGLFVDQHVKPMTDEQISEKLKEFENYKFDPSEDDIEQRPISHVAQVPETLEAQVLTPRPLNTYTHHQEMDPNMTIHAHGPTDSFKKTFQDDLFDANIAEHQSSLNTFVSRPTATKASDIFRKKK